MNQDEAKRLAAQGALSHLPEQGVIGLGSGSTARLFIQGVAELVRSGRRLIGVPTSTDSRDLAESLGIPLLTEAGPWPIEVNVDGADEVSPELDLIKGGGGYLTREKVVNEASRVNVVVVDESKLVPALGTRFPVPVEVLAFGHHNTAAALTRFGEVRLRRIGGQPFRTDTGGLIYDVATGPLRDPRGLDGAIRAIPGVVETGLFLGRADLVLIAGDGGVRELRRP
ncbi:MAG TPA: ribose-5-phosphate isomerase RpiA [Polyangiaceae bacterium]|nr:ribose-5-phosphate isomerase RpiA [Polyangiaceae bacterium]